MNSHFRPLSAPKEPQSNRAAYSTLAGLLFRRFDRAKQPDRLPRLAVSRFTELRRETVLRAIDQTELAFGDEALTDGERVIWNTGLVLSIFTDSLPDAFRCGAKVRSWPAAQRGFVAMGLPDAAEHVAVLVKELAYRAETLRRSQNDEDASLLRLAELKLLFWKVSAERDLLIMLDALIELVYPWPD